MNITKKELQETINKIQETCKNQDLYRGRQALASRILRIIKEMGKGYEF